MPIIDTSVEKSFALLPIDSIIVDRDSRQRRIIEIEDLKQSIARNGLINPVVIRSGYNINSDQIKYWLVAGERRLQACRELGWDKIPIRFVTALSPTEAAIIELEENIKRSDLEWADLCQAVAKVHALHLELDKDWTHADTAEVCSLARGTVSMYLRVSNELNAQEETPLRSRIEAAGTVREAFNVISRKDARQQADALEEILFQPDPPLDGAVVEPLYKLLPPEETILNCDFYHWATTYSGPKFNFIHCDFPYSDGAFDGTQGRGSSPELYADTDFESLITQLGYFIPKIASISCHVIFWFSIRQYTETLDMLRRLIPMVEWNPTPLIWHKTDNAGVAPDHRRTPRHIYETAFIGSLGDRQIVQLVGDVYGGPTDTKLHPSTKPEPMLRHFFRMFVDENTRMLDPTCGSGAAIRAAESMGAKLTLGLEIDPSHCEVAGRALKSFRTLRGTK